MKAASNRILHAPERHAFHGSNIPPPASCVERRCTIDRYDAVMDDPAAGLPKLLGRGLRRRCPRCGGGDLFPKFLTMVDDCPGCGLHFERDAGYWIGAMIIATAFALAAFLAVFAAGIALMWPEVRWNLIIVATIAATGIVPVFGYPTSRTVWVALDLSVRPLEADEISQAAARLDR